MLLERGINKHRFGFSHKSFVGIVNMQLEENTPEIWLVDAI